MDSASKTKDIEQPFKPKSREYEKFKFAGKEIEALGRTSLKIGQKSFAKKLASLSLNPTSLSFVLHGNNLPGLFIPSRIWLVHFIIMCEYLKLAFLKIMLVIQTD